MTPERLDLNLLDVFNHLLQERRVSRVALKLGVSQPAVSNALARLRKRLAKRGIRLVLDFVPNHLGLDHVWVRTHPEYFVGQAQPFPDSFPVETAAGRRFHRAAPPPAAAVAVEAAEAAGSHKHC